jgi:uncharacterized membrane protein
LNWSIKLSTAKAVFNGAIWSISFAYPFLIYFYLQSPYIHGLAVGLIALIFVRGLLLSHAKSLGGLLVFQAFCIVSLLSYISIQRPEHLYLIYPVLMSLTTALTFGLTLVYPPSMIERIARLRHYEIDEKGIKYLRKVTIIWFSFCILNAVVSLWTLNLDNMQIWVLYNGVISYILMGLLLVGEIIYRHLVYNKHYQ